ncbi:MAG: hypothetical protein HY508_16420 [Acidobacteria bacterium]|nr:hypothetical protein [Acidobacteriota bacterium]
MKSTFVFGAFGLPFYIAAALAVTPCDPSDPTFVCGLMHAEDLVRLPETRWVVASQINLDRGNPPTNFRFGPLEAIKIDTREVRRLYPTAESTVDWDGKLYQDCSAPPETLSPVGLNVRPLGEGKFRLFVDSHGGRESVEVIDITLSGERFRTTWRGCVRLVPELGVWPNGVAPLPDDGIVVSGYNVAIWRPGRGWTKVEGFKGARPGESSGKNARDISFANGVEVSPDGLWVFIADSPMKSVIRVPVSGRAQQTVLKLDFLPDNLRWGEDGRLYVTGPTLSEGWSEAQERECVALPICDRGFAIAQINPDTLTSKEIFRSDGIKGAFGDSSTALQVGDHFWIGTARGDRVAILPLKP